jgi:hypothetical protein
MGFLDKAKKMAEQAQAKLDEVQGQFNQGQAGQQPSGPVTEYDKHGRPVTPAPVTPDAAAPVTPDPAAPPVPAETPGVPPTDPAPPAAGPTPDPGAPTTPGAPPQRSDDAPPKLSSGDPLAG